MMLDLDGPVGRLEALLDEPTAAQWKSQPRAIAVLCHPHTAHGGTMHTKVVYQAAKALVRTGCAVLRFNFRGAGSSAGAFDAGPGEMDDFRAALEKQGMEPQTTTPEQFASFLKAEYDKWLKIIKDARITLD